MTSNMFSGWRLTCIRASVALAVAVVAVPAVTTVVEAIDSRTAVSVVDYTDRANWLCRPDLDDVCDTDLDATSVAADGTLTIEPFVPASDAPVDCFYVYPTISRDPGSNSDLEAGPEERFVVQNQAAPLGTGCRMFAPVYRQVTLTALASTMSGSGDVDPDARETAYGDVVNAWNAYLENDNDGRGVILVGHSQGAGVLSRLIAEEIDPEEAQRDLLVSAFLAGTSVQVPIHRDVGGAFQNVPLCRADDQYGCIVTWSSFRSTVPPPGDALFGRGGEGTQAGCTNPAALGGGEAELIARFPAAADASILTALRADDGSDATWVEPSVATVTTPYVELPGLVRGSCVEWGGFSWLELRVGGDPADPRADDIRGDLTPEWGMHLIDMNVVMGDLQRLVDTQGAAWAGAR